MKIAKEPYSESLFKELMPLAQKCWDAETAYKAEHCAYDSDRNFKIQPDVATYKQLAIAGRLVVLTLRREAELVGYAIGFTYNSMHHQPVLCAIGDSFYVEPEARAYAAALEDRFELEFESMGVETIGWPVTPDGPLHKLLAAKGFRPDDVVMEKRLCV